MPPVAVAAAQSAAVTASQASPPQGASALARAEAGEAPSLAGPVPAADLVADTARATDLSATVEAAAMEAETGPLRAAEPPPPDRLITERTAADRPVTEPAARPDAPAAPAVTELMARPAPPPRAAPPVQVVWPARQVAPFAVALALGPDSSLTLMLDPVELGRVEVAIDRSRGEAAIRVTAERPETLALLQRDARELERALSDAGFGERGPVLSFSLSQGDSGPAGQGNPNPQSGAAPGQASRGAAGRQVANDAAPPTVPPRRTAHPGLIDLAV